jgi:hypothetical protein
MGEKANPAIKMRFDRRVRLEFRSATITSDAGLLVPAAALHRLWDPYVTS